MTLRMRTTVVLLLALTPLGVSRAQTSTGVIAGRVTTPYAGLLADAVVTLWSFDPERGQSREPRTAVSDSRGEFRFEGLSPGLYVVSAALPGFTTGLPRSPDVPLLDPGPAAPFVVPRAQAIELRDGETAAGVDLVLHREGSIAGRILQPDGAPAAGVEVAVAYRIGSTPVTQLGAATTSARDGRYRIAGLPPGEFAVLVRPGAGGGGAAREPFPTTYYPGVTDVARAVPVTVLEGASAEGIDVSLTPARHFTVSGRVYWGNGIAPRNIVIEYGDPAQQRAALWILSDPGGLFTLTDAPPGTLVLLARADSDAGPLAGLASTEVSMDTVYDVAVTLERPGRLDGRVVYEPGVEARAGAGTVRLRQTLVHVSSLYPTSVSPIDGTGRFALDALLGEYAFEMPALPPGLRVARVLRNGMRLPDDRIRVAGGEQITGVEVVVGRAP